MSAPLTAGVVIGRDYEIERLLARGGMGAVYVARQLSTGRRRALKVMRPDLVADERSRERFVEEAKVGARIASEHVVSVIAAGVDEERGTPWIAMELLAGDHLAAHVAASGPLRFEDVVGIFRQIADAIGAAHESGIVHRDLKPENVFLSESARVGAGRVVKILDFGIAKLVDASRSSVTVTSTLGSPMWLAPEQASPGAHIAPTADVWALGLVAFYLLTGKSYWIAANEEEFNLHALLAEVLADELAPASARARALGVHVELPAGFDVWFARCVDREPTARFGDANECMRALEDVRRGVAVGPLAHAAPETPVPAPSPPDRPVPRVVERTEPKRWPAVVGAVLPLVACLALSGLYLLLAEDSDDVFRWAARDDDQWTFGLVFGAFAGLVIVSALFVAHALRVRIPATVMIAAAAIPWFVGSAAELATIGRIDEPSSDRSVSDVRQEAGSLAVSAPARRYLGVVPAAALLAAVALGLALLAGPIPRTGMGAAIGAAVALPLVGLALYALTAGAVALPVVAIALVAIVASAIGGAMIDRAEPRSGALACAAIVCGGCATSAAAAASWSLGLMHGTSRVAFVAFEERAAFLATVAGELGPLSFAVWASVAVGLVGAGALALWAHRDRLPSAPSLAAGAALVLVACGVIALDRAATSASANAIRSLLVVERDAEPEHWIVAARIGGERP